MTSATFNSTLSKSSMVIAGLVRFKLVSAGFQPCSTSASCFAFSMALRPFCLSDFVILPFKNSTSASISTRGKIGVPLATTCAPAGKSASCKSAIAKVAGSNPNWVKISLGACVMTGLIKLAITRKLAAKWAITLANLSASFASSLLANCQGAVSSIYLFVRLTNFHTSASASDKCRLSMQALKFLIVVAAVASKSASNSVTPALNAGN
ncbi:hypothetical protein IMAU30116_02864 [Lactiplantibacillus plantarum]|nr:hypothetical protein [Lactiplantibacillus plantarum]